MEELKINNNKKTIYFICHSIDIWIDQEPFVRFISKRNNVKIIPSSGIIYGDGITYEYSKIWDFLSSRGWTDLLVSINDLTSINVSEDDIIIPLTLYKGSISNDLKNFIDKFHLIEYIHYGYPVGEIKRQIKISPDYDFSTIYINDSEERKLWIETRAKLVFLKKPFILSKIQLQPFRENEKVVTVQLHHPKIPNTTHTESGYLLWKLKDLIEIAGNYPNINVRLRFHPVTGPKIRSYLGDFEELDCVSYITQSLPKNVVLSTNIDWREDFLQSDLIFCESPSLVFKYFHLYKKNIINMYKPTFGITKDEILEKSDSYLNLIKFNLDKLDRTPTKKIIYLRIWRNIVVKFRSFLGTLIWYSGFIKLRFRFNKSFK